MSVLDGELRVRAPLSAEERKELELTVVSIFRGMSGDSREMGAVMCVLRDYERAFTQAALNSTLSDSDRQYYCGKAAGLTEAIVSLEGMWNETHVTG